MLQARNIIHVTSRTQNNITPENVRKTSNPSPTADKTTRYIIKYMNKYVF